MNSSKLTSNEGIDKISLKIQTEFVNRAQWNKKDPYNFCNLRRRGANSFTVDIHAEIINPDVDILDQISRIILILAINKSLLLRLPADPNDALRVIRQNINRIAYLDEIEFYFDFMPTEIMLAQLIDARFDSTRYSDDHRKKLYNGDYQTKSILDCYDRRPRLIQINQMRHSDILNLQNPLRIEFRFTRHNNRYMNLENLSGTYCDIIDRYLSLLGKLWRKYHSQVAEITDYLSVTKTHIFFAFIMNIACEETIPNNPQLRLSNQMPSERNNFTVNGIDNRFFLRTFRPFSLYENNQNL